MEEKRRREAEGMAVAMATPSGEDLQITYNRHDPVWWYTVVVLLKVPARPAFA